MHYLNFGLYSLSSYRNFEFISSSLWTFSMSLEDSGFGRSDLWKGILFGSESCRLRLCLCCRWVRCEYSRFGIARSLRGSTRFRIGHRSIAISICSLTIFVMLIWIRLLISDCGLRIGSPGPTTRIATWMHVGFWICLVLDIPRWELFEIDLILQCQRYANWRSCYCLPYCPNLSWIPCGNWPQTIASRITTGSSKAHRSPYESWPLVIDHGYLCTGPLMRPIESWPFVGLILEALTCFQFVPFEFKKWHRLRAWLIRRGRTISCCPRPFAGNTWSSLRSTLALFWLHRIKYCYLDCSRCYGCDSKHLL